MTHHGIEQLKLFLFEVPYIAGAPELDLASGDALLTRVRKADHSQLPAGRNHMAMDIVEIGSYEYSLI